MKDHALTVAFAFDGDADRCLCVDGNGKTIDGDDILYLCANYLKGRGELTENAVAATVMSNFGLVKALERKGIQTAMTAVGDRFVYEYMQRTGVVLGGEQSGHIIFSKYATTGDGVLTSLQLMEIMLEKKTTLSALLSGFDKYPQTLVNLRVVDKQAAVNCAAVKESVKEAERSLGGDGRVLLRASGTEQIVRVMAEAREENRCKAAVERVCSAIAENGFLEK